MIKQSGIPWVLAGVFAMATMDALIKWVVNQQVSVIQIIAVRSWILIAFMLIILPSKGGLNLLKTQRVTGHLARAFAGFVSAAFFFWAMKYLPLASVSAIFFCSAFFMTAGSQWLLHEPVGWHRWLAVIFGFIGVLIVTKPGTELFHPASIVALMSGAAYAFAMLSTRVLSTTEPNFRLVFFISGFNMVLTTVIVFLFKSKLWKPLTIPEMGVMTLVSILALSSYFCITHAFRLSSASLLVPFEYTGLIWATLYGLVFWQEIPLRIDWLGIGLIVSAGLVIFYREHQATRGNERRMGGIPPT